MTPKWGQADPDEPNQPFNEKQFRDKHVNYMVAVILWFTVAVVLFVVGSWIVQAVW